MVQLKKLIGAIQLKNYVKSYWKNDAKADEKHHPVVEVLVDGEIEVIDIIKDIDGIIN